MKGSQININSDIKFTDSQCTCNESINIVNLMSHRPLSHGGYFVSGDLKSFVSS